MADTNALARPASALRTIGDTVYQAGADGLLYPIGKVRQQPQAAPQPQNALNPVDGALNYYLGPTGIPDKLAALNQIFNPIETIGQSMSASQRLFAPETDGWGRVQAAGDMLSGVAGFAAPLVAAAKVGAPAASAVVEAFTGLGNSQFARDDFGGMKVPGGGRGTGTQRGQAVAPDLGSGALGNADSAGGIQPSGTYAVASEPYRPRSGYPGAVGERGYAPVGRVGDWDAGVEYGPQPGFINALDQTARGSTTPTWRMLPDNDPMSREVFAQGLAEAKASQGPYGAAVDANPASAYADQRVFVADNGQGYFSVAPTGEINAVAARKGSGIRGLPDTALNVATQNGGRWLSVFDTDVARKYAENGFRPIARVPFDPQYAPDGWDFEKMGGFNNGQPDVVFMAYDPSYTGGYTPGSAADSVPAMSYDEAQALAISGASREGLADFYRVKATDMDLPMKKRKAPNTTQGGGYVDRDFDTPAPSGAMEDLSKRYPRNPDPTAPLPLDDRGRFLVDNRKSIAKFIADKVRKTGQMDANTRKFYHSDGPLYRAALKSGLSPDEASAYVNEFGMTLGATSPRTAVQQNVLNATSMMAKRKAGIAMDEVIGPQRAKEGGGTVLTEQGYGGTMLGEPNSIHRKLLTALWEGGDMDVFENTKPSFFGPNMVGNRSGATVDTHAIRGTLLSANELMPGSIPDGYILPKFRKQYAENPQALQSTWLDDTVGKQMIDTPAGKKNAQTEYPVFADIIHDVADELGVDPAEAQSMMWFGFGGDTNLASEAKTVSEVFDDRLKATADLLGLPISEVAKKVFRREIPLAAIGGGAMYMNQPDPRRERNALRPMGQA